MIETDGPKYWDDEKQEVVEGVQIRKSPTKLADILGTYVWVYSGDPEFGGEVEEMFRSHFKDDTEFITRQSITLNAKEHTPNQPVAPENVSGHITWGTLKVLFDGVRRVREGWSSDESASWMESYWEVLLTGGDGEDKESDGWLDMDGNAVGVAVVLDDNGCPFLVFDWSHPEGCHSSWSGYYVGKRMVEGKKWQLTDEERDRLGIGRSEGQVKGGSDAEDEDEDEETRDDDEEDSEEDAQSGEDESKDVGAKRKASDGETGANKRRRA